MKTKTTQKGFSLIELITTMAVAGIVLSLGVPTFRGVVANNSIVADTNKFVASVNMARVSAIKYQRDATICPSETWNSATPSCTASTDWSNGWIVFVDKDRDNVVDADEVITVNEPLDDRSTFTSTGTTSFTYNARGFVDAAGELSLCDNRASDNGRRIRINGGGRISPAEQSCS